MKILSHGLVAISKMNHTNMNRRKMLALTGATIGSMNIAGCIDNQEYSRVTELPHPTWGSNSAPVTVKTFEDYLCPGCRQFELEVMPQLYSNYITAGKISIESYDYPIPVGPQWSWKNAEAARAVQDLYDDPAKAPGNYLLMKYGLYEAQENPGYETIELVARAISEDIDTEDLVSRVKDGAYRPVVEADRQLGEELEIAGTPTIFVNDKQFTDYRYETVAAEIEAAL
jgi:protein-disulfide isomerase